MKKLLYIIPLLAMLSCTERWDDNFATDDTLSTTISVLLPQLPAAHPQTRAMGIQPTLTSLHVAVFDKNGYLLEYVPAVKQNAKGETKTEYAIENHKQYNYSVNLTPTNSKTTLHFIGNGPDNLGFGTETEVLGKLFTEGGNEAYWQRVVLENGIVYNAQDNTIAAAELANDIYLIRNFAWIHLTETVNNFEIESYCVVNTYDRGSVAPYNTAKFGFATYGSTADYNNLVDVDKQNYNGFIPAGAVLNKSIPNENTWFKVAPTDNSENYAYFVYEREKAIADHPYILVKGNYGTGESKKPCYYKIDLRDENGYFPIIRNFRYSVELTKVEEEGFDSKEEAAASSGSGDVSVSVKTEKYTNISNNEARIYVSDTEFTVMEETDDLEIRFKFALFDDNGKEVFSNTSVTVTEATDGDDIITNISTPAAVDNTSGEWYKITVSTQAPVEGFPKSQAIIIKGTYKVTEGEDQVEVEKSLQRKVIINLRTPYQMQLVCDPQEISRSIKHPFDVLIKLPYNMNSSVFPLDFQLEAENQSMTPDQGDDLPVVTGKSIVTGKNEKTTIGFIKRLEYSDFLNLETDENNNRILRNKFKNNKNVADDESETKIYAKNKYFDLAYTDLGYYDPFEFKDLEFSVDLLPAAAETAVDFSFEIPADGLALLNAQSGDNRYIIVTLENLAKVDNETNLVYLETTADGKVRYKFEPTATDAILHLETTTANATSAKVTLSAYHFDDASEILYGRIYIPAGNIKGLTGNYTYYLYSKDPGRTQNPGNTIGGTNNNPGLISVSGDVNSADIDLTSELYKTIMEGDGCVYVRYTTTTSNGWWQTTNYYVATVRLSDLIDEDGATLKFFSVTN